jgi:hypothetical protein
MVPMWHVECRCGSRLSALTPTELLWIVALAIEDSGGPSGHVLAIRRLAARLEDLTWWLAEPPGQDAEGLLNLGHQRP